MIAIRNTTRGSLPRLPFDAMAKAILGARYELSLVVCGDELARRMNIEYRKQRYKPNVLSFPLAAQEGELFLNVRKAEREAHAYGIRAREREALLFVHGCFHLKGMRHSPQMEREERRVLRAFGFARSS